MEDVQDPGLSAGEAARRVGVATTTLRTWDRRYGLGPAVRVEGRHRRYRPADLQRLEAMRRLTDAGVAAATAARVVREAADPTLLTAGASQPAGKSGVDHRLSRRLWRAAMALDRTSVDETLAESLSSGVVDAWEQVMCPAIRHVGNRVAASGQHIESEHFLSVATSASLARVVRSPGRSRILLACAPQEQHTLSLEALDAALGERGVPARMLGARVPVAALGAAVDRMAPAGLVVWSQNSRPTDLAQLMGVLDSRPRPAIVALAGPGWGDESQSGGLHRPRSLADAVTLLANLKPD